MNIYVGNLPWEVTQQELAEAFQAYGQVTSVNLVTDKYTGRSRGFGFVEMPVEEEARAAISALNGKDFKGRTLSVNVARPRNDSSRGRSRRSANYNW